MKPLRVAVITKHSTSQDRECRNMGYWSYPVPEFEWQHFVLPGKRAYVGEEINGFDLVVQEDAGPTSYPDLKRPLVYIAIDSTLSPDHLESRLERAKQADLILVDHDRLENFTPLGIPVHRWNYCVNDYLMRDYGEPKTVDVAFHCGGNEERAKLRVILEEYCHSAGLVYRSGVMHPIEYAQAMARAKIVVNWPRTPTNRPHRVFDAMACGACLVSEPLIEVSGDGLMHGTHYREFTKLEYAPALIAKLLLTGEWESVAQKGKRMVMEHHTWAIRARQLRAIIKSELGI